MQPWFPRFFNAVPQGLQRMHPDAWRRSTRGAIDGNVARERLVHDPFRHQLVQPMRLILVANPERPQ